MKQRFECIERLATKRGTTGTTARQNQRGIVRTGITIDGNRVEGTWQTRRRGINSAGSMGASVAMTPNMVAMWDRSSPRL